MGGQRASKNYKKLFRRSGKQPAAPGTSTGAICAPPSSSSLPWQARSISLNDGLAWVRSSTADATAEACGIRPEVHMKLSPTGTLGARRTST